jgi:hypothetical protein
MLVRLVTVSAAGIVGVESARGPSPIPFELLAGPLFPAASCLPSDFCAVVDQNGVLYERGGTHPSSWRSVRLSSPVVTVSCLSQADCLVADVQGDVATIDNGASTDPRNLFPTRLPGHLGARGIALSCSPHSRECVVVRRDGWVAIISNSGHTSLHRLLRASSLGVIASCSGTVCIVGSGDDQLLSVAGSRVAKLQPITNFFPAYSTCEPAARSCLVASGDNYRVAVWGQSRWDIAQLKATSVPILGCDTIGQCIAVDGLTNKIAVFSNDRWTPLQPIPRVTRSVGLASALSCVVSSCNIFFSRGYEETVSL